MTGERSSRLDQTHEEPRLLAELQHRVRNTLATTRMIVRRSAETSASLEDYVAHLDGRLAALARIQNAAIRDPSAGIDLGLLVADELTSAGQGARSSARLEGPAISLHPRAAEPFALALHELSTNAIKFGALSVPAGRIAVTWAVERQIGAQTLTFDWVETGLALDSAADRREGFGTLVLTSLLTHNLGARTEMSFPAAGLFCRIIMPLTERVIVQAEPV